MIAVLSHSLRMAQTWLEVDHKARLTAPKAGNFPNGAKFKIFTSERELRGNRDITHYLEAPHVNMTSSDFCKLREMREVVEHIIARNT